MNSPAFFLSSSAMKIELDMAAIRAQSDHDSVVVPRKACIQGTEVAKYCRSMEEAIAAIRYLFEKRPSVKTDLFLLLQLRALNIWKTAKVVKPRV